MNRKFLLENIQTLSHWAKGGKIAILNSDNEWVTHSEDALPDYIYDDNCKIVIAGDKYTAFRCADADGNKLEARYANSNIWKPLKINSNEWLTKSFQYIRVRRK